MSNKHQFEEKSARQLADVEHEVRVNDEPKTMEEIIAEEIEDDAEGGYYYYEDEDLELTRDSSLQWRTATLRRI